jgi:drug/metabolite transporter (DMT)-like permease
MTGSPDKHSTERPLATLTLGALCISFAPVFVKMIDPAAMGPTAIGAWRCLFGAFCLAVIAKTTGRSLLIPRPLMGWALLAGFVFFADLFVWHRSIIYVGAGMATILGNTQVFATAVLSFFLFREQLTLRFIIAAVSAMGGVVLLIGVGSDVSFSTDYMAGIGFGLATGVAYAGYLITLKTATRRHPDMKAVPFMMWTAFFSSLFLAITGLIEPDPFWPPDVYSLGTVASLGLVAQALGWMAIAFSLSRVQVSRAGLILLLQPTLATVWGMLFFAEQMQAPQFAGALVTLIAIYYGTVFRARGEWNFVEPKKG